MRYVVFTLDDRRYGVPVEAVVEVALRVALVPLPGAPPGIEGLFSCRGHPVAAVNLRRRLGHPERPPSMADRIVIVRGAGRLLGLVVDTVHGLVRAQPVPAPAPAEGIAGVVAAPDGLWLVRDVERLLSAEEEAALSDDRAATPAG